MCYNSFAQLMDMFQKNKIKSTVAVVAADNHNTLKAVIKAKSEGFIDPILIGNKEKIIKILNDLQRDYKTMKIVDEDNHEKAASLAVKYINSGEADIIMKGSIHTADLLRPVVQREAGLRTARVMSHLAIYELKSYHKLIAVTDGGMNIYPNLEEKRQIIENAVDVFNKLGYKNPKVAALSAVERVNPKMPETVDAKNLKQMNKDGIIRNCIIEGPISYDLAISQESAREKGYHSPVAGDADILLVPNIVTGNILNKALIYSATARMAGFVLGAKIPIVLTSRSAGSDEKYLSLALSALVSKS